MLALGDALRAHATMLATAESCTGGLIAAACTAVAGSSDWFERGFVTYSNAAKTELLGVDVALIQAFGAVSAEVARAMARRCPGAFESRHRSRGHRHCRAGRRRARQAGWHRVCSRWRAVARRRWPSGCNSPATARRCASRPSPTP